LEVVLNKPLASLWLLSHSPNTGHYAEYAANGTGSARIAADLSPTQIAVYRHAVRNGHINPAAAIAEPRVNAAEIAVACDQLQRLKLLSMDEESGLLIPEHPDIARCLLNERLVREMKSCERKIHENSQLMDQLREVLTYWHADTGADGVLVIRSPEQARQQLEAAAFRCSDEALTTHLGAQTDADRLNCAADSDVAMIRRGVRRRLLYQHICRSSLGMRAFARRLAEHGGLVRTTSESYEALTIFDRATAFVPFERPGGGPPGAVVITHQAVVEFLCRSFERLWSGAIPFEDEEAVQDVAIADNRMLLLRLMASGLKDEAIAHRLGIATRTCRRHMTALMAGLGVTSRFQLGLKVAQLGVLPLDPPSSLRPVSWADAHPLT
jgi:Bacterial regulatory proteins, luxR family